MKRNNAELYLIELGYKLPNYPIPDLDYQPREIEVEVWDDSLYESLAQYECSRCLAINIDKLSDGSAGNCSSCSEIDYWDLLSIEIDGRFVETEKAFKIFQKRGLIKKLEKENQHPINTKEK
tara:strand:- start:742 stop:1107 length:366 start_codon:yes stop_codon:yes gene_type:complete